MIEFICEGENCGKVVTVKRVASLTHRFCKTCYKKNWKHSNPDKVKAAGKRYRDGEAGQASSKAYYQANSEKIIKNSAFNAKKRKEKDPETYNEQENIRVKGYYSRNLKREKKPNKICAECFGSFSGRSKKDVCRTCYMKSYLQYDNYVKPRMEKDVNFKLARILRTRLKTAIKMNQRAGSFIQDLGCSIDELKLYLEKKFQPGMTWENWGRGRDRWHIDHIYPLAKLDLTNRSQFLKACNYKNMQPLWEQKNLQKRDRIE